MLVLRREGVIDDSRGQITVLNRHKLEKLSCECYAVVKKEADCLRPYLFDPTRRTVISPEALCRNVQCAGSPACHTASSRLRLHLSRANPGLRRASRKGNANQKATPSG